jgi:hypothetical protein
MPPSSAAVAASRGQCDVPTTPGATLVPILLGSGGVLALTERFVMNQRGAL